MTTNLQQAVAELSTALVELIGKFKAVEAAVNASSAPYNTQSPLMPAAMQQAPVAAPSDAPQIKIKLALWEKPNSLSGALTVTDVTAGGSLIAEMRVMLYVASPNDRNLALNGYILPKDQQSQPGTKLSDAAIGSVYVTKNGTLSCEANLTATPVYNNLRVTFDLLPNPARTSENHPILNGEVIVQHHFYTESTRAQLAAAGHGMQQQPQQNTMANLLASPGQPADFGVITGGLQQPTMEQPQMSVMNFLS